MKQYITYFFALALLITASIDAVNNGGISPTFVGRSQSLDNARKVAGSVGHTLLYNTDDWYSTFDITFEYDQTFRNGNIAQVLFGKSLQRGVNNSIVNNTIINGCCNTNNNCNDSCGSTILIQGSQVSGRNASAWLADYFYLPSTYNGSFSVSPKVKEFIVNFDYFAALDELCCGGTYVRVYAPFVHSRWDLGFCELANTSTSLVGYDQGYFGPITVPASNLLSSFSEYSSGFTPAANALGSGTDTLTTPIVTDPLLFGKFNTCSRSKNGLADLRVELGWNFWQTDCSHLGVNLQIAAPTGTKRRAEFLFDPVIGNGKHWELGGGFTGHYLVWSNEDDTRNAGFYMDGTITHLFKRREQRTFDLKGKPNSRYILAEKFGPNLEGLFGSPGGPAQSQFANEYAPVANLTTFDIKVSTGVQADIVLWFNYTACNWSWDIGYDFYGRSKEKFECPQANICETGCITSNICSPSNKNTWALKGDARIYGFTDSGNPVALSATETNATICAGTNVNGTPIIAGIDPFYKNNSGIDNPALASAAPSALTFDTTDPSGLINTSIQPIFIQCSDVDFARTRSISNKIFTHINYTWDYECWIPYLGIGGFAEFGSNSSCNDTCNPSDGCTTAVACNTNCNGTSVNTTFSKWGIWLKAGLDL